VDPARIRKLAGDAEVARQIEVGDIVGAVERLDRDVGDRAVDRPGAFVAPRLGRRGLRGPRAFELAVFGTGVGPEPRRPVDHLGHVTYPFATNSARFSERAVFLANLGTTGL
jgi:hypothetical protein